MATDGGAGLDVDPRGLLGGMVDAVVVANADGAIVYVNAAAERMLMAREVDVVGLPLTTIIPARLRDAHTAGFQRFLDTGIAHLVGRAPVRLPVLRADGSEVEIELALSTHRTTGGGQIFLGVLRDLDERLELERQRRVTRYLSTSREVMSRLAVGSAAVTLEEAAPVLLEVLGQGLGWDGGAVWAIDEARRLRPVATWSGLGDGLASTMTDRPSFALGEGVPGVVARDGEPLWVKTVATETLFVRRDAAARAGVRSCFGFPIFVSGEVAAVVEMYSRAEQAPEPELLAILQTAGLEIGRYLERAQARRHLVEMAEALQASLLPPHSPIVPGLDVAVRYRASSGEGQVGGDFFDVFPLPDGDWAVFIGDVSGRGPRAAALTALARYTLRAAAVGTPRPSAVLNVLNDVVRRELETSYIGDERFLTVAYLTISPNENGVEVNVACGGHPYPLARRANGTVEEVTCEGDLIGAFSVHESTDQSVVLEVDDLLVLVTDGVLEARRGGEEFGEERLKALVRDAGAVSATELADAVEAAVIEHLGGHAQDDLAIVVLRLPPALPSTSSSIDVRVADLHA